MTSSSFLSRLLLLLFVALDFMFVEGLTSAPSQSPTVFPTYKDCGSLPPRVFFVIEEAVTKPNADILCANAGGQLARLTSAADQQAAETALSNNDYGDYWFGLTRDLSNDQGYFIYNGIEEHFYPTDQGCYSNWETDEPSNTNGNENCAELIFNRKWNDAHCTDNLYYPLCEVYLTSAPSKSPSTTAPSMIPSMIPSTSFPSRIPTKSVPSRVPSTSAPSRNPTKLPTRSPSRSTPTRSPSRSAPSKSPLVHPTRSPTTSFPTKSPSRSAPTRSPTTRPTSRPTSQKPTHLPTTPRPTKIPKS
jgi:hypothetical protein